MEQRAETVRMLQGRSSQVRNICVLAHVDHGKTTLSDYLVASNSFISTKSAGSVRFMDSRPDEQERLITMKASSLCLLYQDKEMLADLQEAQQSAEDPAERKRLEAKTFFLVNLIDSPGHVDFSGEVGAAARCSDGALVLVDAVEGLCSQTYTVLQQAWTEGVRPCLVINKIDRLVVELEMTPSEAYMHMSQLLESANAFAASLHIGEQMAQAGDQEAGGAAVDIDDTRGVFFSPAAGNVVFASAKHNWAFGLEQFARLYEKKLGMSRQALRRALWGDYFFHPKTKSVSRKPGPSGKCMFVEFILDQVWSIYKQVLKEENTQAMNKIIQALDLKIPPRELMTPDFKERLRVIFGRWMPISQAVLGMVVRALPSPSEAAPLRLPKIWPAASLPDPSPAVLGCLQCDPAAPLVVYVAKMVDTGGVGQAPVKKQSGGTDEQQEPKGFVRHTYVRGLHAPVGAPRRSEVDLDDLDLREEDEASRRAAQPDADADADGAAEQPLAEEQEQQQPQQPQRHPPGGGGARGALFADVDPGECFMGIARVFGGTLDTSNADQQIHVFGPKHDPANPGPHHAVVAASSLTAFQLIGRDQVQVESVPAGSVCGIGGLGNVLLNFGTLSTDERLIPFRGMQSRSAPIVRVAVHPKNVSDMPRLLRGLHLLNMADPNVEVVVQESGEHVIAASGEVHLERCLVDLRGRFARGIDFSVSDPLVEFCETIVSPPESDVRKEAAGTLDSDSDLPSDDDTAPGDRSGKDGDEETDRGSKAPLSSAGADGEADDGGRGRGARKRPRRRPFTLARAATTAGGHYRFRVRAVPLPPAARDVLARHQSTLMTHVGAAVSGKTAAELVEGIATVRAELASALADAGGRWSASDVDRIWSLGPRRHGQNVLLCRVPDLVFRSYWELPLTGSSAAGARGRHEEVQGGLGRTVEGGIVSGFQLATQSGPLCNEPLMGVCFVVEEVRGPRTAAPGADGQHVAPASAPPPGQVLTTFASVCTAAMRANPMRLMEPVFSLELQVTAEVLGRLHGVLTQRRARVVSEDLREGTPYFVIKAFLPVAESFGFAQQVRKKTSGVASPQLVLSHWQLLEQDPFWAPTTEEELEEFGDADKSTFPNLARDLINAVRVRKGLPVEKKIVEHAEKQRTLARKK